MYNSRQELSLGKALSKKTSIYTGCGNLEAMAEARNYNNYLISMIEKTPHGLKNKKILDFGAGTGTYADILRMKGIVVDCLEPDKTLQKTLKSKGYKILNNIDELETESYDLIYALNVLEHIEDDNKIFSLLAKALTKKGVILVYVPAFQSLFSSMDKLVAHYRRYRKPRLRMMAEDNNLEIVELHYCDPIGFATTLLFKATPNKSGVISARSVKLYDRLAFPVSRLIEPGLKHFFGKNVVLVAKFNGK